MTTAPEATKKLILVIGATGAQGLAVIDALLAPSVDGSSSPYNVRALTRDPTNKRAVALAAKGVECVKGRFDDIPSVVAAFSGVYGAWVNTDGSTVGEQKEIYAGLNIYEVAKRTPTMRHYVWSSLDYASKIGHYKLDYKTNHYDGKGRVTDFLKAQPSVVSDDDFSWSVVTSGPYMEMLNMHFFGPLNRRKDGTYVFASPVGDGHVSMISLADLGFWARYTFDHRVETSGKDIEVASDVVGWDNLVATFTRVTGQPAVYARLSLEEWWLLFDNIDSPMANEQKQGDGTTTVQQNYSPFWRLWRDDVVKRDMEWVRTIHPQTMSIEEWMRKNDYKGAFSRETLKGIDDGVAKWRPNPDKTSQL